MTPSAPRFPLFNSMRAVAVLLVVGYHVLGSVAPAGSDAAIRPYVVQMGVGVSIFFVISGFLLYRPFVDARVNDRPPLGTAAYAWRRFLRIVPGYWVALVVVTLWLGLDGVLEPDGVPSYFLFGQIYSLGSLFGGLPQAWSLCVEVGFYVALPLIVFAVGRMPGRTASARLRGEWIAVGALFAAGMAYNALVLAATDAEGYTPLLRAAPTFADHFAAGMALAVASVAWAERGLPGPLRVLERFPGLAWAVALVAFWVASTRIGLSGAVGEQASDSQLLIRRALYVVIAVGVITPAVFGPFDRGLVRRFVALRPLAWIGLVSYGVFLYHLAVLEQVSRWDLQAVALVHPYGRFVDVVVLSLALAAVSYYVVERPALSLKRLVGGPRQGPEPSGFSRRARSSARRA